MRQLNTGAKHGAPRWETVTTDQGPVWKMNPSHRGQELRMSCHSQLMSATSIWEENYPPILWVSPHGGGYLPILW